MSEKQRNEKGFTLVEIAIVSVIASLVLFSVFKALSLYTEEVAQAETNDHIDFSQVAISRFFEANGRYPCPARINAVPGDADYGIEECTPANLNVGNDLNNPIDADADLVATPDDFILVGAIPVLTLEPCLRTDLFQCAFRDFFITEDAMYDGWGNKLTYAVTQDLTDAGTFANEAGVIDITDENRETILENEFSAHFVIISHGSNGRGAFNRLGERVQDNCRFSVDSSVMPPVLTPFPSSPSQYGERENCDHVNGIYVSALANDLDPDRTYYDDTLYYRLVELASLWERTGLSEMINRNPGFVGIGDFDDADPPQAQLHVRGDLQAIDLSADRLCDTGGTNCMRPEFLGGDPVTTADGLDFQNTCDNPDQAIVKISNNTVTCGPVFTGALIAGECAKDDPTTVGINEYEVMVGYSNQTGIVCQRLFP